MTHGICSNFQIPTAKPSPSTIKRLSDRTAFLQEQWRHRYPLATLVREYFWYYETIRQFNPVGFRQTGLTEHSTGCSSRVRIPGQERSKIPLCLSRHSPNQFLHDILNTISRLTENDYTVSRCFIQAEKISGEFHVKNQKDLQLHRGSLSAS